MARHFMSSTTTRIPVRSFRNTPFRAIPTLPLGRGGRAWALYGFAIVYRERETGNSTFLTGARHAADAFLRRLGDLGLDPIAYWDFDAPVSSLADKDSSAGAIAASGLPELSKLETDSTRKADYANAAARF
jgi:unsaturated chondroitin disaccharide hydrolase